MFVFLRWPSPCINISAVRSRKRRKSRSSHWISPYSVFRRDLFAFECPFILGILNYPLVLTYTCMHSSLPVMLRVENFRFAKLCTPTIAYKFICMESKCWQNERPIDSYGRIEVDDVDGADCWLCASRRADEQTKYGRYEFTWARDAWTMDSCERHRRKVSLIARGVMAKWWLVLFQTHNGRIWQETFFFQFFGRQNFNSKDRCEGGASEVRRITLNSSHLHIRNGIGTFAHMQTAYFFFLRRTCSKDEITEREKLFSKLCAADDNDIQLCRPLRTRDSRREKFVSRKIKVVQNMQILYEK